MKVIKVDKPKSRAEYRAYRQNLESRSFPFPDGVTRIITMTTCNWESFDWFLEQDGWGTKRIAEMAYELAKEDALDNGNFSFDAVLQARFRDMIVRIAPCWLVKPETIANNNDS